MAHTKYKLDGRVISTLVGHDLDSLLSTPHPSVQLTFAGIEGDYHAGLTLLSGERFSRYPRGTEIRNTRQVSIVSVEELSEIAGDMGIPELRAEWICANLLIEGIPSLSLLPPATRLYFSGGATLMVEAENAPCTIAGASIQAQCPDVPDLTNAFPKAAHHKRGVVASVERPGVIAPGDTVRAEVPNLVPYQPALAPDISHDG